MDHELRKIWGHTAVTALEENVGTITSVKYYAEEIYYISACKRGNFPTCSEYYVVSKSSDIISTQAKAYGTPVMGQPNLLLFKAGAKRGGYKIIDFELAKYRIKNNIPLGDLSSPHISALFAAEDYPDYFGLYPAPLITPFGNLLRYISLENGIFWIETDKGGWCLALCYPIWDAELTAPALELGKQTEYDKEFGIENTLGYLFFSEHDSCVPLFELLIDRPDLQKSAMIDYTALMNAVWIYHPQYAIIANILEQLGANDFSFSLISALFPTETPPSSSVSTKNMISYHSETGTHFIRI